MNNKDISVFSQKIYPDYDEYGEWGWHISLPEDAIIIEFTYLPSSDEDFLMLYYYKEIS